jgi:hypothetical protein
VGRGNGELHAVELELVLVLVLVAGSRCECDTGEYRANYGSGGQDAAYREDGEGDGFVIGLGRSYV